MDNLISTGRLAELLDLSPRRLQQLVTDGVVPQAERGKFDLQPAVRAYIGFLRTVADRQRSADGALDLTAERALLAQAQRARLELDMRVRKGELIEVQDVLDTWAGHIGVAKQALLGLPAKVAGELVPADKRPLAEAVLRREIKQILTDLAASDGQP